jgi:hypothetical protein
LKIGPVARRRRDNLHLAAGFPPAAGNSFGGTLAWSVCIGRHRVTFDAAEDREAGEVSGASARPYWPQPALKDR